MCIFLILVILVSGSDGKFSEWNSWSSCSASCGEGLQSRERIAKFETCYSELRETKECNNGPCEKLSNLALNSSVTSSSLFLENFPASNIVDGNINSDFYGGGCSQTEKNENPWVRIELNTTALIYEVVLYNRGDCCSSRLNNVVVYVGNTTDGNGSKICGNRNVMDNITVAKIKCCEGLSGHIVHIRIPGPQFLSLCEVQVYGTGKNLAIGKAANQSSTHYPYSKAEKAVDGDLATKSATSTCVAWWRVDLGKRAMIYKVLAYPDEDGFLGLTNTNVTIGNNLNVAGMTSCGKFTVEGRERRREGLYAYDITCEKALTGRYIQVNKNIDNGYTIAMFEFEAYGHYI